jgi:hypothetical protein
MSQIWGPEEKSSEQDGLHRLCTPGASQSETDHAFSKPSPPFCSRIEGVNDRRDGIYDRCSKGLLEPVHVIRQDEAAKEKPLRVC